MREFKASLDNVSKIVTGFIIIIGIVVLTFATENNPGSWVSIAAGSLLLILTSVLYYFRPLRYYLTDDLLIIHRYAGEVKIKRSDIARLVLAEPSSMLMTIRTFGNGGIFGYTGRYWNKRYGDMRWYVTQRKNYVVLDVTGGPKIVLSPDEPEKFKNELLQDQAIK